MGGGTATAVGGRQYIVLEACVLSGGSMAAVRVIGGRRCVVSSLGGVGESWLSRRGPMSKKGLWADIEAVALREADRWPHLRSVRVYG